MADTGSIIQLHNHENKGLIDTITDENQIHIHENKTVIDLLTDSDGNLYYNDAPIYTQISSVEDNLIYKQSDGGLYVSGLTMPTDNQYNILSRFAYYNDALYFDAIKVSQEYETTDIDTMISDLWNTINAGGTI